MANILYLTRPDFIFDDFSGGMGTKTRAIVEAWSDGGLNKIILTSDLSKIAEAGAWTLSESPDGEVVESQREKYDVVLIELLQIHNLKTWNSNIELLTNYDGKVIVYGSDSELLRMPGSLIEEFAQHVDVWVPNCRWQADYFRDYDLPVMNVVYEPIDCDLFIPSENSSKIIVAGGMVSHGKNSTFFVELFEALKDIKNDYTTAYVGGADTWGGKPSPENLAIQHAIEKQVDIFHGTIPQTKVARALSESAIGVLNPFYETCNRFHMELMACGKPTVCGVHVCYDERPVTKRFTTLEDCIEKLRALTDDFTELPDLKHGVKAREYAELNFAYSASLKQFKNILRSVL